MVVGAVTLSWRVDRRQKLCRVKNVEEVYDGRKTISSPWGKFYWSLFQREFGEQKSSPLEYGWRSQN